jgi:hypothetical protein
MENTMKSRPSGWAAPTEEDILAWEALPRDAQLRQLQELFASPACNEISPLTMDEVIARARSKVRERIGG